MFYNVRQVDVGALGALPAWPSSAGLKSNSQWVRYYEVDTSHQLKVCPVNPPLGCYMINGFAWGQREWYSAEFEPAGWVAKPLPKPFPHPGGAESSIPVVSVPAVYAPPHLQAPLRNTTVTQPDDMRQHATPGVGAVVGVGLFVAIGLTLLL
jgi:hypothetical protein